jgi:hypothetical protein
LRSTSVIDAYQNAYFHAYQNAYFHAYQNAYFHAYQNAYFHAYQMLGICRKARLPNARNGCRFDSGSGA